MTGAVVVAQEPAQAGTTLLEAPKSANEISANELSANDVDAVASDNEPGVLLTAHPKPAKRLNARERQMAKRSGGGTEKDEAKNGTKPMTAAAKFKAEDKAEKAKLKASQKAQKADTKARKISAAKAAKAARG